MKKLVLLLCQKHPKKFFVALLTSFTAATTVVCKELIDTHVSNPKGFGILPVVEFGLAIGVTIGIIVLSLPILSIKTEELEKIHSMD
jgi:hypothetical protein